MTTCSKRRTSLRNHAAIGCWPPKLSCPRSFVMLLLLGVIAGAALVGVARPGRSLALAGQGFGLALLIGLVFVVDYPFNREKAVSSRPIVQALAAIHARGD